MHLPGVSRLEVHLLLTSFDRLQSGETPSNRGPGARRTGSLNFPGSAHFPRWVMMIPATVSEATGGTFPLPGLRALHSHPAETNGSMFCNNPFVFPPREICYRIPG